MDNSANSELIASLAEGKREAKYLIDILQRVQAAEGYLSKESMLEVARLLNIHPAEVWSVATFYTQFRFTPPGRHPVRVCMGTACHLAGGQLVLEALERELNIKVGETSADREFSLERVACIGCCALAPVVQAGQDIFPHMNAPKAEEVVIKLKAADAAGDGKCSKSD